MPAVALHEPEFARMLAKPADHCDQGLPGGEVERCTHEAETARHGQLPSGVKAHRLGGVGHHRGEAAVEVDVIKGGEIPPALPECSDGVVEAGHACDVGPGQEGVGVGGGDQVAQIHPVVGGYAERLGPFVGREDESATVVDSVVGAHRLRVRPRHHPVGGGGLADLVGVHRIDGEVGVCGSDCGIPGPERRRSVAGLVEGVTGCGAAGTVEDCVGVPGQFAAPSDVGVGAHRECGPP